MERGISEQWCSGRASGTLLYSTNAPGAMTVRLSHRATQGTHKLSAVVEELHACTTARYIKADWTFQNVTLSPVDAGKGTPPNSSFISMDAI